MEVQVRAMNFSCDSLDLEDDWASGLPFNTAKLLLVAAEGVDKYWPSHDTTAVELKAETPCDDILQVSVSRAQPWPTLLRSKLQPSVNNNPKSAPTGNTVAPTVPAQPWVRPQRPIRATNLQSATPDVVVPDADQAPKACPPELPLARRPVSAPSCPSGRRLTPLPKSIAAIRQSRYPTASMMAPMMRGRHMEILDEQYLKDHGARGDAGKNKKPSRPTSVRSRALAALPKSSGVEDVDPAGRPEPQKRLLGPEAALPLLKGQAKVRAQMAQREATREVQEARLKAQFRSRLTSCSRARSEPRSSKPAANGHP